MHRRSAGLPDTRCVQHCFLVRNHVFVDAVMYLAAASFSAGPPATHRLQADHQCTSHGGWLSAVSTGRLTAESVLAVSGRVRMVVRIGAGPWAGLHVRHGLHAGLSVDLATCLTGSAAPSPVAMEATASQNDVLACAAPPPYLPPSARCFGRSAQRHGFVF